MTFRAATLLEELDIEACIVQHRRGELYRLAAKRIRELEAALPEEKTSKLPASHYQECPLCERPTTVVTPDLLDACEMLLHNEAIRRGKAGKAWDGDFVMKCIREGVARAHSSPPRTTAKAKNNDFDPCP